MLNAEKLFEGGRRLSVVISILWVIGCLVPVFFSGKEVWHEHESKVFLRESFWEFANKETDKIGPWTVFRYEKRWDDIAEPTGEVAAEFWFLKDELHTYPPKDSLEADLKELRQRSLKSFADKTEGPAELAIFGVLLIFAIRKTCGWVVRGFLGSDQKQQ